MYRIVLLAIVLIGFSNCKPSKETSQQTEQVTQQIVKEEVVEPTPEQVISEEKATTERADLSFLLELNGKYPYESKLFESEPMKSRLVTLLGDKYDNFTQRMDVQMPIRVNEKIVFIEGLMKHGGGTEEAAMVVDVEKNLIWALIYSNGKDLNIYKDDRDVRMPDALIHKIKEF